jgi:O-antigen ligase
MPSATSSVTSSAMSSLRGPSGRLLVLYAALLVPLLGGYLMFDRAFAYLRVPGTPLFVGELLLGVGVLGVLAATGHLLVPLRDEPILALLGAFFFWGITRALPGLGTYGMDTVRDSALFYYCGFAFLAVAATARSPVLPRRLVAQLDRMVPWLLVWLPVGLLLQPVATAGPFMPFSTVPVLSHKPGNAAIAAVLALGCLWLFPERRSHRWRAGWSLVALLVIALAATQNRGGLLGVSAGAAVGLVFVRERLRLIVPAVFVLGVALGLAILLSVQVPWAGEQGRAFSASQLAANVVSLGGKESPDGLGGTVQGREQLWSRILDKQERDGRLVDGSGFGPNLAADVGIYDEGKDTLRSPHNSHLHVLARMGLVGLGLWILLWLGWFRRLVVGCRRLEREGRHARSRTAVLCLVVATSILVSSTFDPQLEGPQVAALLWTVFGIGVAVTSVRDWAAEPP